MTRRSTRRIGSALGWTRPAGRYSFVASGIIAVAIATGGPGSAQEYCVACTEPNALYRCVIDNARPGESTPLQMLCVTAMARDGNHGTCSVTRATVFECNGPVRRVAPDGTVAGGPAPAQAAAAAAAASSQPASDASTASPRTVEELARKSGEKATDGAKKTGDTIKGAVDKTGAAIGGAAKKTWNCLSTLFTRC